MTSSVFSSFFLGLPTYKEAFQAFQSFQVFANCKCFCLNSLQIGSHRNHSEVWNSAHIFLFKRNRICRLHLSSVLHSGLSPKLGQVKKNLVWFNCLLCWEKICKICGVNSLYFLKIVRRPLSSWSLITLHGYWALSLNTKETATSFSKWF